MVVCNAVSEHCPATLGNHPLSGLPLMSRERMGPINLARRSKKSTLIRDGQVFGSALKRLGISNGAPNDQEGSDSLLFASP